MPEGVKNYLIDIDGTITEDATNEEPERMATCLPLKMPSKPVINGMKKGNDMLLHQELKIIEKLQKIGLQNRIQLSYSIDVNQEVKLPLIDNHLVKATRYKGKFTDLVEKEVTIQVFDDSK